MCFGLFMERVLGFVGGSRLCGCVNRKRIAGIAGLGDGSCLKLGLCGYQ
jgi:hypothetical protein